MTEKRSLGPAVVAGQEMPWSAAVVANGFVFVAGTAGAVDAEGRAVEGIDAQTRLAFDRSKAALEAAGSSFGKAVRINQYLSARELRQDYKRARDKWLGENVPELIADRSYAAILLIGELADPAMMVEIEVTAVA